MSIRTAVAGYLDKLVDARFKRDDAGRPIFFPWGFGAGRVVTDGATEAKLRLGIRRMMICTLIIVIPVVAAVNGFYQFKGIGFVAFFAACVAAGFAVQLYPVWLARNLPKSVERLSYASAALQSLDRFGRKFLIFGLATSVLFALAGAAMLVFPLPGVKPDPIAMAICVIVFAPLSALYLIALRRRNRSDRSVHPMSEISS